MSEEILGSTEVTYRNTIVPRRIKKLSLYHPHNPSELSRGAVFDPESPVRNISAARILAKHFGSLDAPKNHKRVLELRRRKEELPTEKVSTSVDSSKKAPSLKVILETFEEGELSKKLKKTGLARKLASSWKLQTGYHSVFKKQIIEKDIDGREILVDITDLAKQTPSCQFPNPSSPKSTNNSVFQPNSQAFQSANLPTQKVLTITEF